VPLPDYVFFSKTEYIDAFLQNNRFSIPDLKYVQNGVEILNGSSPKCL
jgi:hypothetical protein